MCFLYRSEYINSVFAGTTQSGERVDLVAGSHSKNFPYFGDQPWDNVLLRIGEHCYQQTTRTQGLVRFDLNLELESDSGPGRLRIRGPMSSAETGQPVEVEIEVSMVVTGFRPRQLGKRFNFLDIDWIPGSRWHPYATEEAQGFARIDGQEWKLENMVGGVEHGRNLYLRPKSFAFYYDYQSVIQPRAPHYAHVWFTMHALGKGWFGRILDAYLVYSASEEITFTEGRALDGNRYGVTRPPQNDSSVVLIENQLALKLATLRRQLITTQDSDGRVVTGLREIFEPH